MILALWLGGAFTRTPWPEVLAVVVASVYLWGISNGGLGPASTVARQRLLAVLGFVATAELIFLGGIWPSAITLVAIPALPAPFIFAGTIARPALASGRPKLRIYLTLCVVASALAWAFQIWWELRGQRA
jgi:hypothetical protein